MSYRLIIRDSEALLLTADRATQDLRQQANYILVNGNSHAAEQFLELVEVTFAQLATIPKMGVDFCPPNPPTLGGTGIQSPPELGDLGGFHDGICVSSDN
jgi:plasmid stabilization system protein ParE